VGLTSRVCDSKLSQEILIVRVGARVESGMLVPSRWPLTPPMRKETRTRRWRWRGSRRVTDRAAGHAAGPGTHTAAMDVIRRTCAGLGFKRERSGSAVESSFCQPLRGVICV
jgi:hypothetical protein